MLDDYQMTEEDFEQILYNKPSRYIFLENAKLSYQKYQEKLGKDVYSEMKKYRVEYLLYGLREREIFKIEPEKAYNFLRTVYDDGGIRIYQTDNR